MRIHNRRVLRVGTTPLMPPSKDRNDRGVTMDEVARVAGVSQATVSRVVNGNPRVNSEAKRQVERAIERLGFVPNIAARTLVTRRSDSIGVVITEPTARVFGDPFFAQVLRGVSSALTARRQKLVLFLPQDPGEERDLAPYLAAGHVDGVIMYSLHGADPLPEQLHRRGIPVVVGGLPPTGARVSYVDNDNRGGALLATRHLIELGRRRIATISGPSDMPAAIDRRDGYRQALAESGIGPDEALEAEGSFTQDSGVEAMQALLARDSDLDAVFVANDLMAAGALQVLRATGRRVPDDVAVVGFDDAPIAQTTVPTLTSVRQSPDAMGHELVNLLLDAIEHRDQVARKVVLATELIIRDSSGGTPTEHA
jgi:DNA-binding LacI/PurR family transcriptional regulator